MNTQLNEVSQELKRRGFTVEIFPDANTVKEHLLKQVGDSSVGFGGSMSVKNMQLYETLEQKGNEVYWHWYTPGAVRETAEKARLADYYITSINALTKDGRMVSVDGRGNRIATTFFGPPNVIFVVGRNKLVETLDDAFTRLKTIACIQNAKRLNKKTPCGVSGVCTDCRSKDRFCCVTSILEYLPDGGDIEIFVYLVDEDLGY
ncbi:MAG: lactate utilization protein [Christensenellaceae bacterium]|jgi:L-lactate utilization protein LutB